MHCEPFTPSYPACTHLSTDVLLRSSDVVSWRRANVSLHPLLASVYQQRIMPTSRRLASAFYGQRTKVFFFFFCPAWKTCSQYICFTYFPDAELFFLIVSVHLRFSSLRVEVFYIFSKSRKVYIVMLLVLLSGKEEISNLNSSFVLIRFF